VFDEYGYAVQQRRVTDLPGLYLVGLLWLYTARSGLAGGVGLDDQSRQYAVGVLTDQQRLMEM
jgi:hypothetical protein